MKKMFPLFLLLAICLTGCSSKYDPAGDITIKWSDGVMSYNGTTFEVDSYSGYEASVESGLGGLQYSIMLDSAKDVTNITFNTQGILEENMDDYKGCYYYTEYLGSKLTMAISVGEDAWSVCQCITAGTSAALVATYTEEYISKVPLTNGQVYVDFGKFTFGNSYDVVTVRPDCALISGIAKVSQDTYNCTTPVSVIQGDKEFQLMKGSSAKYDYYTYDGYLIQISGGLDITNYITFK